MGDVAHGMVGLRLVSCVTIGEPIRTKSVMGVVTHRSLEAEETSDCDTQLF